MEAHSADLQGLYDKVKVALMMETDRPGVLRQAIMAIRKGGTLSIPGVYGGLLDKVPFGAAFGKGIIMKMGQTHMHKYMKPLLEKIEQGKIDPSRIISHRITLDEGAGDVQGLARQKAARDEDRHRPLGERSRVARKFCDSSIRSPHFAMATREMNHEDERRICLFLS